MSLSIQNTSSWMTQFTPSEDKRENCNSGTIYGWLVSYKTQLSLTENKKCSGLFLCIQHCYRSLKWSLLHISKAKRGLVEVKVLKKDVPLRQKNCPGPKVCKQQVTTKTGKELRILERNLRYVHMLLSWKRCRTWKSFQGSAQANWSKINLCCVAESTNKDVLSKAQNGFCGS